jgi:uncharacterized protein YjgD (DUF1641 family)
MNRSKAAPYLKLLRRYVARSKQLKALLEVKEGKSINTLISLMNNAKVKQGLYIMLKLLKALG